ncbi:hypothetical protein WA158_001896 [Blastocystis sp. Blastoise]
MKHQIILTSVSLAACGIIIYNFPKIKKTFGNFFFGDPELLLRQRIETQLQIYKQVDDKLTQLEKEKTRIKNDLVALGIDVDVQIELNIDSDLSLDSGCDSYSMSHPKECGYYFFDSNGKKIANKWDHFNAEFELKKLDLDIDQIQKLKDNCVYGSKLVEHLLIKYIDNSLPPEYNVENIIKMRKDICAHSLCDQFDRIQEVIEPYLS